MKNKFGNAFFTLVVGLLILNLQPAFAAEDLDEALHVKRSVGLKDIHSREIVSLGECHLLPRHNLFRYNDKPDTKYRKAWKACFDIVYSEKVHNKNYITINNVLTKEECGGFYVLRWYENWESGRKKHDEELAMNICKAKLKARAELWNLTKSLWPSYQAN